MGHRLHL